MREWAAHVEAGPHNTAKARVREEGGGRKRETGSAWWAEKEKMVNSAREERRRINWDKNRV